MPDRLIEARAERQPRLPLVQTRPAYADRRLQSGLRAGNLRPINPCWQMKRRSYLPRTLLAATTAPQLLTLVAPREI